jgi:probable addiction module antidote protein
MSTTFKRFDAADHLRDEADIAAFLEAAGEFDDPATTVATLATVARARNMSATVIGSTAIQRQTGAPEGLA